MRRSIRRSRGSRAALWGLGGVLLLFVAGCSIDADMLSDVAYYVLEAMLSATETTT